MMNFLPQNLLERECEKTNTQVFPLARADVCDENISHEFVVALFESVRAIWHASFVLFSFCTCTRFA